LLDSLDPRALLSRGYAMVRDTEGAIVASAAKARGAGHLRLIFADGEVPVAVDGAGAPPPRPVRKPAPDAPKRGQGELF
jgi:exodeoxyribonuclease VII large subunit